MPEHFQMFRWFLLCLHLVLFVNVEAGTTLEELKENEKSSFSSITSVKGASETNRHHFKATVDDSIPDQRDPQSIGYEKFAEFTGREQERPQGYEPFPNGFMPVPPHSNRNANTNKHLNLNEFNGHNTLDAIDDAQSNGAGSFINPYDHQSVNPNPYGFETGRRNPSSSYGAYVPPPMLPYPYGHGYQSVPAMQIQPSAYPNSIGSYQQANALPFHPQNPYNPYPFPRTPQYAVEAPRGYRIQSHKLKLNTEYQENGQHSGSFKELNGNGNCGYGSGFCGGYNGAFNRPGF